MQPPAANDSRNYLKRLSANPKNFKHNKKSFELRMKSWKNRLKPFSKLKTACRFNKKNYSRSMRNWKLKPKLLKNSKWFFQTTIAV